jgi:RES domain-containing protein
LITAWRAFKACHAATALTGEGARLYGGRWNSPGVPVLYCASSPSLAALEILVGLQSYLLLRDAYLIVDLAFDRSRVETLAPAALPPDWRAPEHPYPKGYGDAWAASSRSLVLEVPSAVVPLDTNYLVNPLHPDFATIRHGIARPFPFDARLIKDPAGGGRPA